jgi:hypothetical protein
MHANNTNGAGLLFAKLVKMPILGSLKILLDSKWYLFQISDKKS